MTVALLLIVVGVLALLTRYTDVNVGLQAFLAAGVFVVGLGLLASVFSQRQHASRGLIALGLILAIALLTVSGGPWRNAPATVGDHTYRPTTAADVRPSYGGGLGNETLDLTAVDPAGPGGPITTRIDHGIGNVRVLAPASADIRVIVNKGAGNATVFGRTTDGGFFPGAGAPWSGDGQPELVVTINLGAGNVEVFRG